MTEAGLCAEEFIADYRCCRAAGPIIVDGTLDERSWQMAARSPRFEDMVTGEPGLLDTRAAALWDDEYLYIGLWIEEPFVEARLTERDSLIFAEKDVEVFIDGGDCYYEFEINALGTVYEVFFVWRSAYTRGSRFDVPEFDLLKRQALTFGGNEDRQLEHFWWGTHPRGLRWAFLDWDMPGLRTAVQVQGTLNDNTDVDRGWTVELAFPWNGLSWLANGRSLPPQEGDVWRIFFGRFQAWKPSGIEVLPHPAWSWNRHGAYDTHRPECFTRVHFTDMVVGT